MCKYCEPRPCGTPEYLRLRTAFFDDEETTEIWIDEHDGKHSIEIDGEYIDSLPIAFCPMCGRWLREPKPELEAVLWRFVGEYEYTRKPCRVDCVKQFAAEIGGLYE